MATSPSSKTERSRDAELLASRTAQVQRGGARAAVLGVNDGLVSVLCIILGVAGAGATKQAVLLAGFAGLIAGAISMAVGEWISVTSQVELFQGVLADLKQMVTGDRELLIEQLKDDFEKSGLAKATAAQAAKEVAAKDETLYREYANNVMEVNPDELGSPWTAAFSSLALFTLGAMAALIPWFFIGGIKAIILSVVFTGIGGLITGGYVAKSSGNSIAKGALRQLGIIALAAVVTYGVGYLFGTTR
jgi:VIT1/CCC1 family predicted Fe2+/Mn2+ transporter